MANVKITDLPSLSTMSDTDVMPVVNVGTNTTEQITGANLKTYFTTGIANLSVTGDIVTGGNISGAGDLDIDGDGTIGGNLFVTGNINFSGNVNQISGNSGSFYGNAAGVGALYTGIPVGYSNVVTAVIQSTADLDDYTQINAQNLNHGATSSMEYVVTGDFGTDTADYIDMGFSSSTWDGTQTNSLGTAVKARDGWIYVQGGGGGGNLILGTTTAGRSIKFNAGGPNSANTVGEISNTGLTMTGIISSVGNVQAGNLRTAGLLSVTGTITANSTISTSGTVIAAASLQATGMTGLYAGTSQADTIGTAKTTGTITIGGPSQTGQISLAPSTATQTILLGSGATGSGNTKLINIGGSGTANSTTNFFVGPTTSAGGTGQFNFQNATQVSVANTGALALSVAGTVTASVIAATGQTSFSSVNTGTDSIGVNKTTGTITVGSLSGTGNISVGVATTANSTVNIHSGALGTGLTKTINLGTAGANGSVTNITVGPATPGTGAVSFASGTTVLITNTSANALAVSGTVTGATVTATSTVKLPVFANTTIRDITIPTPATGMMVFVTGTGMQVYGATQWNTISGTAT